jgi:hypothetical protein
MSARVRPIDTGLMESKCEGFGTILTRTLPAPARKSSVETKWVTTSPIALASTGNSGWPLILLNSFSKGNLIMPASRLKRPRWGMQRTICSRVSVDQSINHVTRLDKLHWHIAPGLQSCGFARYALPRPPGSHDSLVTQSL